MRRIYIFFLLILFSSILYAQRADEALLYSKQYYNGTARSAAMGGAFGALGGDFTSIAINPAGLGVYQSSECTFTANLSLNETTSYNDNTNTSLKNDIYSFGISNLGFVSVNKPRLNTGGGWQNFNFAIGYNKLNNYRRSALSSAPDAPSSLLNIFVYNSDGAPPLNLGNDESLAFKTYLIDTIPGGNNVYSAITDERLNQKQTIDEKGYAGEFLMAFGANYGHKVYIGASLGIQTINYRSRIIFSESIEKNRISDFNDYLFEKYYKTSGVGANFKLGVIYKPIKSIRLGASIHTPTFFTFNEEYANYIISNFNSLDEDGYSSYYEELYDEYSYKFRTPLRLNLSGAAVLGKRLIVSADYEVINYSNSKFYDGEDGEDFYGDIDDPDTNDVIKASFQNAHNLRAGVEFRVNPTLSIRGGYSNVGNSYKIADFSNSFGIYSGGIGFRQNNFSFDLAYMYSNKDNEVYYYSNEDFSSDLIEETDKNHQVRMTFGFRF